MVEVSKTGFNDKQQLNSVRNFLVPTLPEVFLWLVVSVMLMLLANYHTIWGLLTSGASVTSADSVESFNYLSRLFANHYFAQVTVLIVWGVVGCIAYMTVWSIQHFYVRVREDVEESGYVKSVTVNEFWYTKLGRYGFLACNVFIFIFFLAACGLVIFPFAFGLGATTIAGHGTTKEYLYIVYGVLLLMISLFCLRRLGHMMVYAFRTSFGQID